MFLRDLEKEMEDSKNNERALKGVNEWYYSRQNLVYEAWKGNLFVLALVFVFLFVFKELLR